MDELTIFDIVKSMGAIGVGVFIFCLLVFFLLTPFSAYSAQKWAYRSYMELRRIRELLESSAGAANDERVKTSMKRGTVVRRDPTISAEFMDED